VDKTLRLFFLMFIELIEPDNENRTFLKTAYTYHIRTHTNFMEKTQQLFFLIFTEVKKTRTL
jgi:hypothetical protein